MRLADRTAIVTGGGSEFGRAIVRRFVAEGARVLVADIDSAAAGEVAGEIGRHRPESVHACCTDVSCIEEVQKMVETAVHAFGGLDIVVNNAGVAHRRKPLLEVTEYEFERMFSVNVKGIWNAALAAVPVFRERGGGMMLNVASTGGARPGPGLSIYNSSKGAAITLTRSMAVEFAPEKIRVCALNPVTGETPLLEKFMGGDTAELRDRFRSVVPLGRFSRPEDVANAALFLCSDEAEFLTGVCLDVDGGRSV